MYCELRSATEPDDHPLFNQLMSSPRSVYLKSGVVPTAALPTSVFENALSERPTIIYFHGNVGSQSLISAVELTAGRHEGDEAQDTGVQCIFQHSRRVSVYRTNLLPSPKPGDRNYSC